MGIRQFFGSGDRDPLQRRLKLPAHAIYLHWTFDSGDLHDIEFDITIYNDPGSDVGSYFAPFSGSIGGAQAYGGFQTDLNNPVGGSTGKGALFSTWWSFDAADTRIADDGFIQLGTHEGRFVGVRRSVEWGPGNWRFTFRRIGADSDPADREHDWYECLMGPLAADTTSGERPALAGEQRWIGAMRFPAPGGSRAQIGSSFPSFLEVYSNASTYGDIADWHLDVMAYGNGKRAYSLRTDYPAYPYAEVPNADAWFDGVRDRAHVRYGNETVREHGPATIF